MKKKVKVHQRLILNVDCLFALERGEVGLQSMKPEGAAHLRTALADRPSRLPDDELTRELARLCMKYYPDDVAQRAADINAYVWQPESKPKAKRGAKTKWSHLGNYHALLAIEDQHAEALKRQPGITRTEAIRQRFKNLGQKPWCVLQNLSSPEKNLYLKDERQARNRYALALRALRQNPNFAGSFVRQFSRFPLAQKLGAEMGL
jgi:hypothetical protein